MGNFGKLAIGAGMFVLFVWGSLIVLQKLGAKAAS